MLDAGLQALGLRLDGEARTAIETHARLLLAWTASINLTAIRDPAEVARLHVVDSLTAVPILRELRPDGLLDLGSGGGYPGLPLASALGLERALLVDAVHKKVRFLEAVISATGLERRLHAEAARAEDLARDVRDRGAWPLVTARAVSNLADLVEVALPLLTPEGILVAWKRTPLDEELAGAAGAISALGAGEPRIVDPRVPGLETHRLVVIPRRGRIDARFPRDPAERRRHPL